MKLTLEQAQRMMSENRGNLDLSNTDYTELPDDLTVDGDLNLRDSNIVNIPNNLMVSGFVFLR